MFLHKHPAATEQKYISAEDLPPRHILLKPVNIFSLWFKSFPETPLAKLSFSSHRDAALLDRKEKQSSKMINKSAASVEVRMKARSHNQLTQRERNREAGEERETGLK